MLIDLHVIEHPQIDWAEFVPALHQARQRDFATELGLCGHDLTRLKVHRVLAQHQLPHDVLLFVSALLARWLLIFGDRQQGIQRQLPMRALAIGRRQRPGGSSLSIKTC